MDHRRTDMTPQQVVEYYGSVSATARALKVTRSAVQNWVKDGFVPPTRQYHIHVATNGKLWVSK